MDDLDYVYRALAPWKEFERSDGTISPAAFKDEKGASVEIGEGRTDLNVVNSMRKYLKGNIAKIKIDICEDANVEIFNDHSDNKYHRLLLNQKRVNDSDLSLTPSQAFYLSKNISVIIKTIHNSSEL